MVPTFQVSSLSCVILIFALLTSKDVVIGQQTNDVESTSEQSLEVQPVTSPARQIPFIESPGGNRFNYSLQHDIILMPSFKHSTQSVGTTY